MMRKDISLYCRAEHSFLVGSLGEKILLVYIYFLYQILEKEVVGIVTSCVCLMSV